MYTYRCLLEDIKLLARSDEVFNIGLTESGLSIPAVTVGCGHPEVLIFGAIHAREHVTAKLVAELAKSHSGKAVVFVPMVNIDGVRLAQEGIESAPEEKRAFLLKINGGENFGQWKANINAVDLNVNFNAGWSTGKSNVRRPAPANYIGCYPESESEVKALVSLTKKYAFKVAVCYHAKGEVIYYGYKNGNAHRAAAARFGRLTGYTPLQSKGSAGGYKDWFVSAGGFGLTVEVGDDSLDYNCLYNQFDAILSANANVPSLALDTALKQSGG